jgi:Tfp pilus assembly protein PilO
MEATDSLDFGDNMHRRGRLHRVKSHESILKTWHLLASAIVVIVTIAIYMMWIGRNAVLKEDLERSERAANDKFETKAESDATLKGINERMARMETGQGQILNILLQKAATH